MTLNELLELHTQVVKSTCSGDGANIINAAMGLVGEAAEVSEHIKKVAFQQHPIDDKKIVEELGDLLWYFNLIRSLRGYTMEQILEANMNKMARRYPSGVFTIQDTIERKD